MVEQEVEGFPLKMVVILIVVIIAALLVISYTLTAMDAGMAPLLG